MRSAMGARAGSTAGGGAEASVVRELAALSSRGLSSAEAWVADEPASGLARALLVLATADTLTDTELKAVLVRAYEDARTSGSGRDQSLVYGIYLSTHRQYRMTAEHLVGHFAQWPGDVAAGLMLGAFHACGDRAVQAQGDALIEQQYRLAGEDSWPWASWTAGRWAEQGRADAALALAEHALSLCPRSGVAVHARAHAEHELGAGPATGAFVDRWLEADPRAVQYKHLNWHAALQSLACGDFTDARRRADAALDRADVGMRSATNWRLLLAGQEPARRCDLEHIRALLAEPGGMAEVFRSFNLALALAVEAATDDLQALAYRASRDERPAYREALAPVVQALAHLTAGYPHKAVDLLAGLGEQAERIGGVRVEREIIQDTLARTLIETGEHQRAAHLLHKRITTRRHHTYEDLLLTPPPASAIPTGRQPPADTPRPSVAP